MSIHKSLLQGFLLIFSVLLSLYLIFYQVSFKIEDKSHLHLPDAFMQNATITRLDKQGRVESEFFTPHMLHYPDDDTIDITSPQMTLYLQERTPWQISANFGRAYHDIEKIDLWDQVHCHQTAGLHNLETTLSTTTVTLFPKKKHLFTQAAVTATQPGNQVDAIGLRGDLDKGMIELLSQVRGHYEPPKTQ